MATSRTPTAPKPLSTGDKKKSNDKKPKEITVALKLSAKEGEELSNWIENQKGLMNTRSQAIKFLYRSAIENGCQLVAHFPTARASDPNETTLPVQMDIEDK
jgi:hypothetical protein